MCGPAAPITCENTLRAKQILSLTKSVDCVWGCYCAPGYLRSSYNGKCVLEDDCRDNKAVDFAPQIPGLFKHLGLLDPASTPKPINIYNHNEKFPGYFHLSQSYVRDYRIICIHFWFEFRLRTEWMQK